MENTLSIEEIHRLIGELTLQNYLLRKVIDELKNANKKEANASV